MPNFHGVAQWARDIDLKKGARFYFPVVSFGQKKQPPRIARQELKEIGEFLSVPMKLRRELPKNRPKLFP